MKATVRSAGAIIIGALLLCLLIVAISRQNAIRVADRLMLAALPAGWSRFEASPVLWVGGHFKPCWWIRYADADHAVDLPHEVTVSFTGHILWTSLPKPTATRPSNNAMERTATRRAPTSCAASALPMLAMLVPGGRRSSFSR
jgi:hypothetical protein